MKEKSRFSFSLIAFAFAVVLVSATGSLAAEFVSVSKDEVNVRSGPSVKNELIFKLPKGYPLKVLDKKDKWLKVSDFENDKGWIYGSLVSKTPYVIVKVKEGNIRSGAGTNYDKVGTVTREVILKKLDKKGDWIKVSHPEVTGWIHSDLVWP